MNLFKPVLALWMMLGVSSSFADTPPQVINKLCATHQWFSQIQPAGIACTQPNYTDIAGSLPITTVVPGSYTNLNATIGADGRITSASNGSGGGGAVSSVFTRTGAVTAQSGDYSAFYDLLGAAAAAQAYAIQRANQTGTQLAATISDFASAVLAAIGYTPEDVANKATDLSSNDNTHYPTTAAVTTAIAAVPTPTPVMGNVNFFAGYDNSGNLFSIPGWQYDPTYFGVNSFQSIDPPNTNTNTNHNQFTGNLVPSQASPNNTNTWNRTGVDIDPTNTGFAIGDSTHGALVMNEVDITARTSAAIGNVTGGTCSIDLGDPNNVITGGSSHAMGGQDYFLTVESGFTVTNGSNGVNMSARFLPGSAGNGFVGTNSSVDVAGTWNQYLNIFQANGNFAPTNAFTGAVNYYVAQGQIAGQAGNVNAFSDFLNINSGANLTNGYTSAGLSPSFHPGAIVNNFTGINISPQIPAGVLVQGAQGVNVDLSQVVSSQQKRGLNVNDGAMQVSSNVDTQINGQPGGEFQQNLIGGLFHIAAGFPITDGSFGFGNNLGPTILAEDDMGPDFTGVRLGYVVNGLVNQIAVTAGKTLDSVTYMAAGGGIPAQSTGGTITDATLFRALGFLPEGGTLNITNLYGFKGDALLDAIGAANVWGVYIAASTADNYMKKDLVIGGSTGHPESGYALDVTGQIKFDSFGAGCLQSDASGHITPVGGSCGGGGGGNEFAQNVFRIYDDTNVTAKIAFSASAIPAATVRTLQMSNFDTDLANLLDANIGAGAAIQSSKLLFNSSVTLAPNSTTTTPAPLDNSTKIATTAYVDAAVAVVANGRTTNTVSTNFTVPTLTTDYILNVDTTGGVVAITMPDAVLSDKFCLDIKNIGSPVNDATMTATGIQTIDGAASYVETNQNDSARFCALSGVWFVY